MASLTPVGRLEWLYAVDEFKSAHTYIDDILNRYNTFLESKSDEDRLKSEFENKETAKKYMSEANVFGQIMFDAINEIGQKSVLHRLLVV
jgi:uncharacterized protein YktA (UPF0223 family)